MTSLIEAMALLNADHSWRKYQVDYPEDTVGRFSIVRFEIAKASGERIDQVRREGMDRDTGYGTFRKLVEDGKVWMSDTAVEIKEHYPFWDKIRELTAEHILITGLGLGVAVHGALMFPSVKHIDVVEINPEVAELIGKYLPADKVTVHVNDAYTVDWPEDAWWDLAWHDIWIAVHDSNLPQMDRLEDRYRDKTRWQECWQRDGCLRMAYNRKLIEERIEKETEEGIMPPEALDMLRSLLR